MSQTQSASLNRAATLELGRRVLRIEAEAILALIDRIDGSFTAAVELILAAGGRVIVSGIGKSGHIARKIAATLSSTGTPAYFVHAAEANHGDLGMIARDDVLIALSNSGEAEDLLSIVPLIKRRGGKLIAITGNAYSSLAREADVHLDARVAEEACPLNLAPTASTTAALALGDALAVALLDARGFSASDFAHSHPGGALGRRLLTHVRDVMRAPAAVPRVAADALMRDALLSMTRGGMGMTAIVAGNDSVTGIFTDGDLRRAIERGCNFQVDLVRDYMTANPRTIGPDALAMAAVEKMDSHRISQLLVVDAAGVLVGALNTHDLMQARVI